MRSWFPRLMVRALIVGLAAVALFPLLDTFRARREARALVQEVRGALERAQRRWRGRQQPPPLACAGLSDRELLRGQRWQAEPLASWSNLGGCGAGGGSSAVAGGAKWVGRGVRGGLVDVQCIATQAFANDNGFTSLNTRIGTSVLEKWSFGLTVPVLYKTGPVTVLGQDKTARLAGFGDLGLEVARKLGVTNATQLSLLLSLPVGASDAVRQGIVLPQHLQLGSGVLGATLQAEHTLDRDWGLYILGGSFSYNGWENGIGDFRAPSASAYGYLGYRWGPLVPSAGLTLFGKFLRDRERGADRPSELDPFFLMVPSLALEWSTDLIALLLYSSSSFSYHGFESVSISLGATVSLF